MLKLTQKFFALAKSTNICFTKLFSVPTNMIVMVVLVFMTWRDNKQAVMSFCTLVAHLEPRQASKMKPVAK